MEAGFKNQVTDISHIKQFIEDQRDDIEALQTIFCSVESRVYDATFVAGIQGGERGRLFGNV